MKIYIVGSEDYDGTNIYGCFSSREKAVEALDYLAEYLTEQDITEWQLDPLMDGEKHETFYYFHIFANGTTNEGKYKNRPSLIKPVSYSPLGENACPYHGLGRTPEEAKENAMKAKENAHPIWQISASGIEIHHSHPSTKYKWECVSTSPGAYAFHEDRNVCIIALNEWKATGHISECLTVFNGI